MPTSATRTARFHWLARAYAPYDGGLTVLKVDRLFSKVNGDPRHAAMLKKLNLGA